MWCDSLPIRGGNELCANLAESSHEWSDLAVVGRVHVGAGVHQELDHVEVSAVRRQPQRSVPFLVPDVDVGVPTDETGVTVKIS